MPWYVSDRRHGLLVHTSNAVRVEVGSMEHAALSVVVDDTSSLDWFVVAGRPDELLPRYTALTGAPGPASPVVLRLLARADHLHPPGRGGGGDRRGSAGAASPAT
jgi:hypothetical protein